VNNKDDHSKGGQGHLEARAASVWNSLEGKGGQTFCQVPGSKYFHFRAILDSDPLMPKEL
jgi:hypothetical protein